MQIIIINTYLVGRSIEASTLENPRTRTRILRVFEAKGQLFFRFRGSFEVEGSLKVRGFFKAWVRSNFRGFLKKPRKNSLKTRGFSRILEKTRPRADFPSNFEAYLRSRVAERLEGVLTVNLEKNSKFEVRSMEPFSMFLTTLILRDQLYFEQSFYALPL